MPVPVRLAAVATPSLLLVYAVARWVDGRDGVHGPGGAAWDVGHVAFLAAFVGFGVLAVALGRAGGPARRVLSAACLVGVGLFCWVILTDLLPRLDAAASLPVPLMLLGPPIFVLTLVGLLATHAHARTLPWWSPVLVAVGLVAVSASLDLLAVAALLVGVGLTPLVAGARRSRPVPTVGGA